MFKENQNNNNETDTIIGPSVKVEGDFVTEGNIIVEGTICGTIKTSRDLKVGPNSKIFANVSAENALISGEIQGNVVVGAKTELTATAKIFGDIKTGTLIINSGAILNGKCQMTDGKNRSAKPEFSKQKKLELKAQPENPDREVKK
ncbi:MAG: polymer-forming cytoskeletal protein [Patescibacteria group bacterium]